MRKDNTSTEGNMEANPRNDTADLSKATASKSDQLVLTSEQAGGEIGEDSDDGKKKGHVLITVCSMILSEAAYIVEWIEFLRLQGVERFVLYNDRSSDSIELLPKFYEQRDPTVDVVVLTAKNEVYPKKHRNLNDQLANLQHCQDNYGNATEWILVLDVDEFVFSHTHGTLRNATAWVHEHERKRNTPIPNLYFGCSRFGTSGQQRRFRNALVEAAGGEVRSATESNESDGVFEAVGLSNLHIHHVLALGVLDRDR